MRGNGAHLRDTLVASQPEWPRRSAARFVPHVSRSAANFATQSTLRKLLPQAHFQGPPMPMPIGLHPWNTRPLQVARRIRRTLSQFRDPHHRECNAVVMPAGGTTICRGLAMLLLPNAQSAPEIASSPRGKTRTVRLFRCLTQLSVPAEASAAPQRGSARQSIQVQCTAAKHAAPADQAAELQISAVGPRTLTFVFHLLVP